MRFLFILPLLFTTLFAQIHEITEFDALMSHVHPKRLVILDVDNTLIEPVQTLGSDQWFQHRIEMHKREGASPRDALEFALAEWEGVQNITEIQTMEPTIPTRVRELQEKGFSVIGLTTRGLSLATRTVQQLLSVGIDLSLAAPTRDDVPLVNTQSILFRKGILFTGGTHKGMALMKLFERIGYTPTEIVCVDDKEHHIRRVEETCEAAGIKFIGLRYGKADEKVKSFSYELADIQFEKFRSILSDDDARTMLHLEVKRG